MRVFTAVWAALSWSDFMITSWPAVGSAFAFSLSSTPSRVASLLIAGLRSSVTSPFAVEMFPFLPSSLPSSTLRTAAWARLLAFSQSVCTLGRCSSLSAAAGPTVFWSAAASAAAAPCVRGGSRSRSWASTSTRWNSASLSFCAIAPRTSSFASSCDRGVCPGLVVEQLTLRPDRERRNEQQNRREPERTPDQQVALLAHRCPVLLTSACLRARRSWDASTWQNSSVTVST